MRTHASRLAIVRAMRAASMPAPQARGLWQITRTDLRATFVHGATFAWACLEYGFDDYPEIDPVTTSLYRWTDATIGQAHGECVMSDDPRELRKHIAPVLQAAGRVLVTGLGLGCVVRGLLTNADVTRVDVIEVDADVLAMVAPTLGSDPRLVFHHGDARTYRWPTGARWDLAWHDVWQESPDTQVAHAELLARYRRLVIQQGAWGFPRWAKRLSSVPLVGGARRTGVAQQ